MYLICLLRRFAALQPYVRSRMKNVINPPIPMAAETSPPRLLNRQHRLIELLYEVSHY
jgi:hypothetical protein